MKIVILTIDDCLFLPIFFKVLLEKRAKDIAHIIILSPKGYYRSAVKTLMNVIILYGIIGLARLLLLLLYKEIISYIAYIKKMPAISSSVRILAKLYDIPYSKTSDIDREKTAELLKSIKPDIIFSVSLPQIIPDRFFHISRYGIFNIHTSLLPKYRGVLPVFWALLNGEEKIGSTVHKVDKKIDAGDIIIQDTFDVEPNDTLETCTKKGKLLGANLALKAIDLIEKESIIQAGKIDLSGVRYYSFPTRTDVANFKKRKKLF